MSDDTPASPSDRSPNDAPAGASRTVLGVLLALLIAAVVLALWYLIVDDGDDQAAVDDPSAQPTGVPTPLPIPTVTPTPVVVDEEPQVTVEPTVAATPVPAGFEACGDDRRPLTTSTYIVDTLSTPLNQRAEPRVDGELVGAFDPGQSGLVFTGECVVNVADGYVWWKIHNGSIEVWVASDFVTPR